MKNHNQKLRIIPDLTTTEVKELLKVKSDYIFSFKENGSSPKTFAISRKEIKRITKLYKEKLRYIGDIITFYLNLTIQITVLKVCKHLKCGLWISYSTKAYILKSSISKMSKKYCNYEIQQKVKNKLVKLDFCNMSITHFLEHVGKGMIKFYH